MKSISLFLSKLVGAMLIVMLALVSMPVAQAYADVTTELVPTAVGTYTAWVNDYAQVDEGIAGAVCDGGGPVDYISSDTAAARETVVISLASIPDGSTITSIDVLVADRGDTSEGGTYRTFVRFNGVDSADSAATHSVTGTGGGCTGFPVDTFNVADTVKNAGTTLEIGVVKVNGIGLRVGVLSAIVTYTYPEMDVQGNGISIANNDLTPTITDGTNWGNVGLGIAVDRTFTILNTGTADLNLGAITFGAPGGDFSVVSAPAATVPPGGSTTFTVRLIPTAGGMALRTRTISIVNNDLDENPYTFLIQGTRVIGAPEIEVRGNDLTIIDGDLTPLLADGTDFGTVTVGNYLIHTYTIRNNGDAVLNINTGTFVFTGNYTLETLPAATVPAGGSTTFQVRFTPMAAGVQNGSVRFDDDDPNELTYNFNLTGTGSANVPPTGTDNTITIPEDGSHTFAAGDFGFTDADAGDSMSAVRIDSLPLAGSLTLSGNPVIAGDVILTANIPNLVFTPVANANGSPYASFTFSVRDTIGPAYDITPNTITFNVTASDDASVAVDNTASVAEDAAATTINVRGNDTDIDSAVELIQSVTQPANGTVVITNGGADLTYQPDANYCNGGTPTDDFTYTLAGGSTATVRVTVTCADDPSVAVDDTATVAEDAPATTIDVRSNDTDIEDGATTELITAASDPANGTVVITNGGADLTYQPDADYCNGGTPTDDFTYTLAGGDTATVRVTVTCMDDASDAVDDTATVAEDAAATTIDVRANDTDIEDGFTTELITAITQPINGTVAITNGGTDLTYQPDADYCNGGAPIDDFTYTLAGGDTATVRVTVTCDNDPSNAINDTATVAEDALATTIDVRANDTDTEDTFTTELISAVTQPANGTVVITNGGADLTYQPDADYCNGGTPTDDFTYTLAGGDTATVAVTVTCSNDTSVAVDDPASVPEDDPATTIDVRSNDTDIDGTVELIQSVTQPVNGTVVITNAGADLTYQPDADYCNGGTPTDDFTYTLTGGSTATVRVTVTCVNDEPDFTAANPPAVNEDSGAQSVPGWVTAVDFGPADEDVSQNVFGYIISNSTCGTLLSVQPAVDASGTLTYTVAASQNGTCTFDAQVQDDGGIAGGGDDTGPIHTFTITVNSVPPVVDSIVRVDPNPTSAASVDFDVTFSEDVTGVDVSDFTVTAGGSIIGASVTFVNGTGATRTVTVNTGAGSGTIRLDVVDDDSIRDLANNPLGGTGVGNGNFNTGEFYTIDRGAPTIVTNGIGSIPDTGDGHISEMEVVWVDLNNITVAFSEDVFNPAGDTDPDDVTNPDNYLLVRRGDSAFATTSCAGVVSPDVEVTIDSVAYDNNGGAGPFVSTLSFNGGNTLPNGFYRLIVCGSTSIVDLSGNALAGNGVNPGTDFTRNFLLFFGGAGGGGGGGGTIAANAANNIPATGFAPGTVTNLVGPRVNYANSGITIELPRLKLKLPIVGVPYNNNSWNVDWLTGQVGWLEHTAFPGLNGNSVLTSHVTSRYGSAGPFAKLNKMIVGDMIFVRNNGTLYIYQVEQVLRIKSNDTSVFRHEEKSWLTLITCENFDEKSGTYLDRFVVRARLISTQADPAFTQ